MAVHSRNNLLMCLIFSSSLKGVSSNWFYSLPPYSLCNFEEVSETFLTQYASCWESKRNNHHLLTVTHDVSLKSHIGYFPSQLVKVPNCGEDIFALALFSGLKSLTPYTYIS